MADIRVDALGLENPFIIAASPATQGYAAAVKSARVMPGAIVLRNFGHRVGGGSVLLPSGAGAQGAKMGGQINGFGGTGKDVCSTPAEYYRMVARVRKDVPAAVRVWVSIGHPSDLNGGVDWKEKWRTEAAAAEDAGADTVELHLNTPGISRTGEAQDSFASLVARAVKSVRTGLSAIPLVVKLPLEMIDTLAAVRAAAEEGAAGAGPTARWKALHLGGDWQHSPALPGGGFSSSSLLPILCHTVAEIRAHALDLPLYAGGGVYSAEAALQLVLAGSDGIQLGSLACCHGPSAVAHLIRRFVRLLYEKGYARIQDARGLAARRLAEPGEEKEDRRRRLARSYQAAQVKTGGACIRCGKCVEACWHEGIVIGDVSAEKTGACIGCGYCFSVCPTGALSVSET